MKSESRGPLVAIAGGDLRLTVSAHADPADLGGGRNGRNEKVVFMDAGGDRGDVSVVYTTYLLGVEFTSLGLGD